MRVVLQAGRVAVLGVSLGVVAGLLLGFPQLAPQAALCAAPGEGGSAQGGRAGARWVTLQQARALYGEPGVLFVDARPRGEFHAGHVAGALSVPMEDGTLSEEVVEVLRGARTVVTYCDTTAGCSRSTRLGGLLVAAGLPDVRVLTGGVKPWLDHGYPAEAGTCRLCP